METFEDVPGVNLDLDENGGQVGLEIFVAREVIGTPPAELDFTGELASVKLLERPRLARGFP